VVAPSDEVVVGDQLPSLADRRGISFNLFLDRRLQPIFKLTADQIGLLAGNVMRLMP